MHRLVTILLLVGASGCDFVGGNGPPWNRKRANTTPPVEAPSTLPRSSAPPPISGGGPAIELPPPTVPEPGYFTPEGATYGTFLPPAAPAPSPLQAPGEGLRADGAEIDGWGTVVDPDGDCQVRARGDWITVAVPGTLHDLNGRNGRINAPRILQPITGDFRMVVRVTGAFRPAGRSTAPNSVPFRSAGLIVWGGEGNYVRFERNSFVNGGQALCFAPLFEVFEGGRLARQVSTTAPDSVFQGESTSLYLDRQGEVVRGAVSHDGRNWTGWRQTVVDLPNRVHVGVDVVNTAEAFTVAFDGLRVEAR